MSSHRHLTDPDLPSTTLQPDYSNNALTMLNQYGPKRPVNHYELRRLVLDYLCHQCFVDTAAAFAREAPANGSNVEKELKDTSTSAEPPLNGAHTHPGKIGNGSCGIAPIYLPVPLKENVVERTVRFDTDEDGDAEMGDLTQSTSNGKDEPQCAAGQAAKAVDQPSNATNGSAQTGTKNMNDEIMSDGTPVPSATSTPETYPDWTADDIQTTQLRLLIKENIISGRLKEAIGLIDLHFPAVIGPSALSKLHATPLVAPTTTTSSPINSVKAQRQKPSRVMFNPNRPLGGPTMNRPSVASRQSSYSSSQVPPVPQRQTITWSSGSKESEAGFPSGRNASSTPVEEFPHAMFSSLQPSHVALNLQIQYFVELVRASSPPSAPPAGPEQDQGPSSSSNGTSTLHPTRMDTFNLFSENTHGSMKRPLSTNIHHSNLSTNKSNDLSNSTGALSDDTSTTSSSTVSSRTHSIALSLPHARSLFCYVQTLPNANERAVFVKELESVSGLLAYMDPWTSPIKRYLDQSRRDMLAEIVNAAILVHIGRSPTPILKMIAQQTSFTWSTLSEIGERIPCPKPDDKHRTRPCNFFNLTEFVNCHDIRDS